MQYIKLVGVGGDSIVLVSIAVEYSETKLDETHHCFGYTPPIFVTNTSKVPLNILNKYVYIPTCDRSTLSRSRNGYNLDISNNFQD